MDNFSAKLQRILDILQQIEDKNNFNRQIRKPKLSDLELIAIDLTAEYMGIDSERHLFRLLPESLMVILMFVWLSKMLPLELAKPEPERIAVTTNIAITE